MRSAFLVVALLAASPAQGRASADALSFTTADKSVDCVMVDAETNQGYVDCLYSKVLNGPTTSDGGLFVNAHRHWIVPRFGRALVGASRRGFPAPTRVVQFGQTIVAGNFRCASAAAGLTCVNSRSRHGFFIGRATQRTF